MEVNSSEIRSALQLDLFRSASARSSVENRGSTLRISSVLLLSSNIPTRDSRVISSVGGYHGHTPSELHIAPLVKLKVRQRLRIVIISVHSVPHLI